MNTPISIFHLHPRIMLPLLFTILALSPLFSRDASPLWGELRLRLETGARFDGMANLDGATLLARISVELRRVRLGAALGAESTETSDLSFSSGIALGMGQNMAILLSAAWYTGQAGIISPRPRIGMSFDLIPPGLSGFYVAAVAAWTDPRSFFSSEPVDFNALYDGISLSLCIGYQLSLAEKTPDN